MNFLLAERGINPRSTTRSLYMFFFLVRGMYLKATFSGEIIVHWPPDLDSVTGTHTALVCVGGYAEPAGTTIQRE